MDTKYGPRYEDAAPKTRLFRGPRIRGCAWVETDVAAPPQNKKQKNATICSSGMSRILARPSAVASSSVTLSSTMVTGRAGCPGAVSGPSSLFSSSSSF